MGSEMPERRHPLAGFITGLGSCTRDDLTRLLACEGVPTDALVAVSLALVSTFDPYGPRPSPELYQGPLDALASSRHPLAENALLYLASHARNGRIALEAIQRLGTVGRGAKTRELLVRVAKEGMRTHACFQNDSISLEMLRAAALHSLGMLRRPRDVETQVVLGTIVEEVEGRRNQLVFQGAVEAFFGIGKPSDLPAVLEAAKACRDPEMALRLLCACSKFSRRALLKYRVLISEQMCRALDGFKDEEPLRARLVALAKQVSCAELVRGLASRCSSDLLEHGRGLVSAAALEAYKPEDDTLTEAYLAFARTNSDAQPRSPCIQGLARYARAGMAGRIVRQVVHESNQGYDQLLRSAALLHALGSVRTVVGELCEAIGSLSDPHRRSQAASRSCVCILRSSLCGSGYTFTDLDRFREHARQHSARDDNSLATVCGDLRGLGPDENGLAFLAGRVVSESQSPGVVAMAECLLGFHDDLAYLFLEVLLAAAASVDVHLPNGLEPGSGLARVEDVAFSKCETWLRENLPRFLMVGGRLNRYALDLMRRRGNQFAVHAKRAMSEVGRVGDAQYILDALALKADRECVAAIASAIGYLSQHGEVVAPVRATALRLTAQLLTAQGAHCSAELRKDALEQTHGRFEDVIEVRLAAYEAAMRIACPDSILPLKRRLDTDTNEHARETANAALSSIRQRLLDERPAVSDEGKVITWLGYVAALGDPTLLGLVLGYLSPPHPQPRVLMAALECASKLGDPRAIDAIDRYLAATSPSGDVLHAARRARAALQGRHDLPFLEVLSEVLPKDSTALSLDINYEAMFGIARLRRLAKAMQEALGELRAEHWEGFVTRLDGVCDSLIRHLYEMLWQRMNLDEKKANELARKDYGNRLAMSEFKRAFPRLQSSLSAIHSLRHEATTAHLEDADGGEKPGIGREEAEVALDHFRIAFPAYAQETSGSQQRS